MFKCQNKYNIFVFSPQTKYYNLNGKLPHITYEYTVALPALDVTSAGGVDLEAANFYEEVETNRSAVRHSQSRAPLREEAGKGEEAALETPGPPTPAAVPVCKPADISRHNDVEQPPAPSGRCESGEEKQGARGSIDFGFDLFFC